MPSPAAMNMAEARADRAEALAAEIPELRERAGRAEGEAATLREQLEAERDRAAARLAEAAAGAAGAGLAE